MKLNGGRWLGLFICAGMAFVFLLVSDSVGTSFSIGFVTTILKVTPCFQRESLPRVSHRLRASGKESPWSISNMSTSCCFTAKASFHSHWRASNLSFSISICISLRCFSTSNLLSSSSINVEAAPVETLRG